MDSSRPANPQLERQWLAGLRAGHVDCFRRIFETFAPRLQHFARVWVSSDIAEDLVQDILFDMWQRRDTLEVGEERLSAYLFTAVRKRAAYHLRHRGVETRTEQDATFVDPPAMGTAPMAPDARVVAEDLDAFLLRTVTHLSPLQRSVLMLRWTQGLSYLEIATALSLSENAVKLHMSRARQALRPLLGHILEQIQE